MVYGSEAWRLTPDVRRCLNGVNNQIVTTMTGHTQHEETTDGMKTFELLIQIRVT